MAQAARDLRGGGSGRERDGVALVDRLRRRHRDAALLVGKALLPQRKRGVEAEGLVRGLAGKLRASVGAVDQPALLQFDEVATDAGRRCLHRCGQVFHAALPLLQEQVQNLFGTIMPSYCHSESPLAISIPAPGCGSTVASTNYSDCCRW